MSKWSCKIVALVSCLVLSIPVPADLVRADEASPIKFLGGIAWGFTELSFDEKLDADTSFNTLTATGALSRDKLYSSLAVSGSIATENISEEDEIGSASRTDVDLTIGYRVAPDWALFTGYRAGSTDIDFTVRDTAIEQQEYYRENGLYLGASYSIGMGRAGTFGMTLAYTRFDTKLKFTAGADDDDETDDESDEEDLEFDDIDGRYSGSSDGFSAGLSWVVPLGNSLAMRAQYKINVYDLDVSVDGARYRPSQRLTYFNLGLLYAF